MESVCEQNKLLRIELINKISTSDVFLPEIKMKQKRRYGTYLWGIFLVKQTLERKSSFLNKKQFCCLKFRGQHKI